MTTFMSKKNSYFVQLIAKHIEVTKKKIQKYVGGCF